MLRGATIKKSQVFNHEVHIQRVFGALFERALNVLKKFILKNKQILQKLYRAKEMWRNTLPV